MLRSVFSSLFQYGLILMFSLGLAGVESGAMSQSTEQSPAVLEAFDELAGEISGLDLNSGVRDSLLNQLESARRAYIEGKFCASLNKLNAFLNHLRTIKVTSLELCLQSSALEQLIFNSVPPGIDCTERPRATCGPPSGRLDLVAGTFSSIRPYVYENQGVGLTLVVENRGDKPVADVDVRFSSGEDVFAEVTIESLGGRNDTKIYAYWPGGGSGNHSLLAEVESRRPFQGGFRKQQRSASRVANGVRVGTAFRGS